MSEKYHIARGEEKFGPYTKPQIEEYLAAGTLIQTDLAWTEGQDDWVPLSQLKNSGPPPPPSPDAPPMMGAPTGGHPMPGAMDTPPMMGAPVGAPPAVRPAGRTAPSPRPAHIGKGRLLARRRPVGSPVLKMYIV